MGKHLQQQQQTQTSDLRMWVTIVSWLVILAAFVSCQDKSLALSGPPTSSTKVTPK